MAGKRKAEGIALLSVYAGSDDDDDAASQSDEEDESPRRNELDVGLQPVIDQNSVEIVVPASAPRIGNRAATAGLGIVDYAHDEAAASPEPEDGELRSGGRPLDVQIQADNAPSKVASPKLGEHSQAREAVESDDTTSTQEGPSKGAEVQVAAPMELDVLHDFLPPAPTTKYSEELQTKFAKYLALKKTGRSLNEQLRNTKGYRNPDFLQRAVKYHEIDQIGSCFKKEVFDPHGYDQSDYYDTLALEQRQEIERKEHDRKQNQRVDFVRSNIQSSVGVAKSTVPIMHKVTTTTTTIETKIEGRSSKRSKWDKVELETRSAQSIAVDAIAAANVHAALLSASANAGAGYASFAQQRRREAEEKQRATEKNVFSSSSSSKAERKTGNRS